MVVDDHRGRHEWFLKSDFKTRADVCVRSNGREMHSEDVRELLGNQGRTWNQVDARSGIQTDWRRHILPAIRFVAVALTHVVHS